MSAIQLIGQPLISLVASGAVTLLPLGGDTLLPPQNIGWNYYSVASDALSLEFYWSAPPGGADYYRIVFDSAATGMTEFETNDLTYLIENITLYEQFWSANFYSHRGDDQSAPSYKSDIGPAAPYP
jgi:hypothetical protein